MWKDYSERDTKCIAEWNARAKEVHEKEIHSKVVATKQGMSKDFWFKPIIEKISGEEFVKEYMQKQHTSRSITLDKFKELLINH
jgi:hypothetical protein